jgi:Holliday junction DNA helicase RuvA
MIGYIKGKAEEIYSDCILLDNHGVGYRIFVTTSFINSVRYGDELKVYTYLSVKEDSMTLFGFASRDELEIYKLLITVNGVGPKAAMGIMSTVSAEEFRYAVLTSDTKKLSEAPGIGKKTAQKIILELKDKFDFNTAFEEKLAGEGAKVTLSSDAVSDTVEALEALGYPASDALRAVRKALEDGAEENSEVLIKQALKNLF